MQGDEAMPVEHRSADIRLILITRGLRGLVDGGIAVLLPAYLLLLGFDAVEVGLLSTATLLGSAALTMAVGFWAGRTGQRRLLLAACLLMVATGIGFGLFDTFWPLLAIAFIGTLNPSGGDVSVFLPLEHALLARSVDDAGRTALFARYSLVGSLLGAFGTGLAVLPDWAVGTFGVDRLDACRALFALYALIGVVAALCYRGLSLDGVAVDQAPAAPLGPSRGIVLKLAALFSVDAFAGGLVIQSILALWLFDRFDLSLAATAQIFFWTNLLSAASYLVAAHVAARIGLINTMVFTHLPANLCLMAVPFATDLDVAIALLMVRALLSQMDVPTRTSYVMAVVTPAERTAAASLTSVPRSLASALGPTIGGGLLALSGFGWPLLLAGGLKAAYDLALLAMFRHVKPPEEAARGAVPAQPGSRMK